MAGRASSSEHCDESKDGEGKGDQAAAHDWEYLAAGEWRLPNRGRGMARSPADQRSAKLCGTAESGNQAPNGERWTPWSKRPMHLLHRTLSTSSARHRRRAGWLLEPRLSSASPSLFWARFLLDPGSRSWCRPPPCRPSAAGSCWWHGSLPRSGRDDRPAGSPAGSSPLGPGSRPRWPAFGRSSSHYPPPSSGRTRPHKLRTPSTGSTLPKTAMELCRHSLAPLATAVRSVRFRRPTRSAPFGRRRGMR